MLIDFNLKELNSLLYATHLNLEKVRKDKQEYGGVFFLDQVEIAQTLHDKVLNAIEEEVKSDS
jgi:hypothetical protein